MAAEHSHIPRRLAWRAEHRGKPAEAAECALCCCRRGERSQPRRIRDRRARLLRPAVWLPQCAEGTDARPHAHKHTRANIALPKVSFQATNRSKPIKFGVKTAKIWGSEFANTCS